MRIVFMGTPLFAVPSLLRVLGDGHEVAAVFTQPDRPRGRGYRLSPSPIKEEAERHGIAVYQPQTLKDGKAAELIKGLDADCIVVVAYGRILPPAVLEAPRLGCINIHASLLPCYRGAAPIQWAVINGEAVTGVTSMFMAKGLDTGDMILKASTPIGSDETSGELSARLMEIGAETLSKTLTLLSHGEAPREKQDDSLATFAPMIDKTTAAVDWNRSAAEIHNLVRGMNPRPAAQTLLFGAPFKILASTPKGRKETVPGAVPGTVVEVNDGGLLCLCKDGETLLVRQVQAQGGKRMAAVDYARGHGVKAGTVFGR